MMLSRSRWIVWSGLALVLAGAAFAEDATYLGQEKTYRWNELRTGFGFDPADAELRGVSSNMLPAVTVQVTAGSNANGSTYSSSGRLLSPDLTWIYPIDIEGAAAGDTEDGNWSPIGYTFGAIQSSPTVATVQMGGAEYLAVMFGSETLVNRNQRNPMGGAGPASDTGEADPYSSLTGQTTGAVYALDAFVGPVDTSNPGVINRAYQPWWWYGVRNIPYYLPGETNAYGDFHSSPSRAQHDFFINASDTMIKAWDYDPFANIEPFAPFKSRSEPDSFQKLVRGGYLLPSLDGTDISFDSEAIIQNALGASPVRGPRADQPGRYTDRLHNPMLTGTSFGLTRAYENAKNNRLTPTGGDPLNNRFRTSEGLGAIKSTGTYVRLPRTITYESHFYTLSDSQEARRNPSNIRTARFETNQLYVVGSEDGYLYAFDANPENARRVSVGSSDTETTYLGRLVWTFRAAVRAPLYSYIFSEKDGKPTNTERLPAEFVNQTGTGVSENPGEAMENGGESGAINKYLHVDQNGNPTSDKQAALIAPDAPVITGPITSSPVAVLMPNGRVSLFVGSGIGRMFSIDAETGVENWEFKTTPRGQAFFRRSDENGTTLVNVDRVAAYPVTTSPAVGYIQSIGVLGVFFGADDGKVYGLNAETGWPLGNLDEGWYTRTVRNEEGADNTDYRIDRFGFVTYAFEKGGTDLADTRYPNTKGERYYGRTLPATSRPVTASVVLRPSEAFQDGVSGYQDGMGHQIPAVDRLFIMSQTNYQDSQLGSDSTITGGTIFSVDAATGKLMWVFDRWDDPRRENNGRFDSEDTLERATDEIVRPAPFHVSPAYASSIYIYDDDEQAITDSTRNVLFAVDSNGMLYALKTEDALDSEDRMYWRLPYELGTTTGQDGVYSSPVVTSSNDPPGNTGLVDGAAINEHSYVFVGIGTGIIGIDTGDARDAVVLNFKNEVADSAKPNTGGRQTWGWETTSEVYVDGSTQADDEELPTFDTKPVRTTPAVYAGYLYAGSDNGLLYAWAHQYDLVGDWDFSNAGGTGIGNRRRVRPLPLGQRPTGDRGIGTAGDYFVDMFHAGFNYDGNLNIASFAGLTPTGAPPTSADPSNTVSPSTVTMKHTQFQNPQGAIMEWGDYVAVAAWGPDIELAASNDQDNRGTLDLQLTGPSISAQLRATVEDEGVGKHIYYLNPFGQNVPSSIVYPKAPSMLATPITSTRNPFVGKPLVPGWRGSPYTVTGRYLGVDIEETTADGQTRRRRQAAAAPKNQGNAGKFHLANPLDMRGYFDGATSRQLVTGDPTAATNTDIELNRNGNEKIPLVESVVGDHGTITAMNPSRVNGSTIPAGTLMVRDRSNMARLADLANSRESGSGSDIFLRARVAPSRLRWVGGPAAAYKPLFHSPDRNNLPNTWPLQTPPEPYYGPWVPQLSSANTFTANFIGAEQPPFALGEENLSLDYPDIRTSDQSWQVLNANDSPGEATRSDARVSPNGSAFTMRVAVPRYQPANFAPPSVNPEFPGRGPGYYTVTPTNLSAPDAAYMSWNPGNSMAKNSGPYLADLNSGVQYAGNLGTILPATASLIAQEPNNLTRVYVDVNGNGQLDIQFGEAYRIFVSGVQIRPTEALRVETATIDVPKSPETALPGGYIPFQYYWPYQALAAGAAPEDADPYMFAQRNLYSPFAVYNTGNANLWNLRLDRYANAGHLFAPGIDTNRYFGSHPFSNWPGSGELKRFNLASTLDPLPLGTSAAGGPADPQGWTPVRKPRPSSDDDGRGQLIQIKDVFPFAEGQAFRPRQVQTGLPYLTVAVPPGTPPGRYSTPQGRLVLFEDLDGLYAGGRPANGVLDIDRRTGAPLEPGVSTQAVVSVTVAESRLTDKVTRIPPILPNVDTGVAFSADFSKAPANMQELEKVWQTLAQDTTPAAYRDPRTGYLVTFWSSNRVQVGSTKLDPLVSGTDAARTYHIFGSAMAWKDPSNPPIDLGADPAQFITGDLAKNPWGWGYQGGDNGTFWFPDFGNARWFAQPTIDPWMPPAAVLNRALNPTAGANLKESDVSYMSPAVITDFKGTDAPGMVFYTGTVGVGPQQRTAIFYAPVRPNQDGTVTTTGPVQAVGVGETRITLDPSLPKYQPRPFLITAGGEFTANGYMDGEEVIGLGVIWFGGSPGRYSLYVSTITADELNNNGVAEDPAAWKTVQLAAPEGVESALYPSAYYHQVEFRQPAVPNSGRRTGVLEVAFSGYSRAGRNPDVYVTRFAAMATSEDGSDAKIGDFRLLSYGARGFGLDNELGTLEPLLRVTGEPRPVYRSQWAAWYGRSDMAARVYWYRKPVSQRDDDYELAAIFEPRVPRNLARQQGYVVEADARQPNGQRFGENDPMRNVSAFFDLAAGTVRFTTTDPVNAPAPLSRTYTYNGKNYQDFIYAFMTPGALRVTLDNDMADSMPQVWWDESHEMITDPARVPEQVKAVTDSQPLIVRRDRMWVLWRRSGAPEGTTRASSLFYQTYRLAVDVGRVIPSVNLPRAEEFRPPAITVESMSDGWPVGPYTVDKRSGRLYFTMADEGHPIRVLVNGEDAGVHVPQWQIENPPSIVRYGVGGGFRLPQGQFAGPRAAPLMSTGNDSYPFMFKDPFSDQAPQLSGVPSFASQYYYTRGNNNMWLFWASTRPSRTIGNITASPTVGGVNGVDPFYYDPDGVYVPGGGLMYTSSATDVYFTTLSPDFQNQ